VEIWDCNTPMPMHHPVIIRVNTDERISAWEKRSGLWHRPFRAAGYLKNLPKASSLARISEDRKTLESMFRGTFWAQGGVRWYLQP